MPWRPGGLGQYLIHDIAGDVGEPEIAALSFSRSPGGRTVDGIRHNGQTFSQTADSGCPSSFARFDFQEGFDIPLAV